MRIAYIPDPYIDTIYRRMLQRQPQGSFYPSHARVLPYRIAPTRFQVVTEHPGHRHVARTNTVPAMEVPFIPAETTHLLPLPLEAGNQELVVEAYNSRGDVIDSATMTLHISTYATMVYAAAETIVREWVTSIDFHAQVISGYQLLLFETTLPDHIREVLPASKTSRMLALKNMMRTSLLGSSHEGINSFVSALCQVNPPKFSKFFNATEFSNDRMEDNAFELSVTDIRVWFGSKSNGRRAVLSRMAHNYPGRYSSLEAGNATLIIGRSGLSGPIEQPTEEAMYITLDEDDNSALIDSLALLPGSGVEMSSESFELLFIPNYYWTDYYLYHYLNDDYVPANAELYGDQRWFVSPKSHLDRVATIYHLPDLPESRIDEHGFDDWRFITFHWLDSTLQSTYSIDPRYSSRDQLLGISGLHIGSGPHAGDQLRMNHSVGRSDVWIKNDWPYDVSQSGELAIDYKQGLHVDSYGWTDTLIEITGYDYAPYLTEEVNTSIIVMPYNSRPTLPGSLPTLDYPSFYGQDEVFDDELTGLNSRRNAEVWMIYQRPFLLAPAYLRHGGISHAEAEQTDLGHRRLYESMITGPGVTSIDNEFELLIDGQLMPVHCFSSNGTALELLQSNLFVNLHRTLAFAMHRSNATGEVSLLICANSQQGRSPHSAYIESGASDQFSNMLIKVKGLPLGVEVADVQGCQLSLYRDRYELDMAWRRDTQSSAIIPGLQGFHELTGSPTFRLEITNDRLPSSVTCKLAGVLTPGEYGPQRATTPLVGSEHIVEVTRKT